MSKRPLVYSLLALGVGVACTTSAPGPCDLADCTDPVDGSVAPDASSAADAKADAEPIPTDCTTPNEPAKNPEKCLVDSFGAFVSPTGSDDTGDGTKAKPFKSIGKAVGGARSRIVACEGTYVETIDIGRDLGLYGGVACDWSKAGNATRIESGKSLGLKVSRGTVGLFDVSVKASAGVAAGESSIGVEVASGAVFRALGGTFEAGAGAAGNGGAAGNNYNAALQPTDVAIKGKDGSGQAGGAVQTCAGLCTEAVSVVVEGGLGGTGAGAGGSQGGDGKTAVAGQPAARGKGGIYDSDLGACRPGNPGSAAENANGGAGATAPGTVEGGSWTTSRGATGTTARPGQGGGGGSGGASATVGGGGGGGCGGCGGGKGQGGLSGGSSFAVLSLGAAVTLENVTLVAAAGGKGGTGGAGQAGQGGGVGGNSAQTSIGCPGGLGGAGGQGGGGGGGAGGHSVGVGYTGTKPTVTGGTATFAPAPSEGGDPGATGASATAATAGAAGKTGADLQL